MSRTYRVTIMVLVILMFAGVWHAVHAQGSPLNALNLSEDGTSIIQKAFAAVKRVLKAIGDWFVDLGIDIGRLIRLFGEFLVLLFESLAKLARWVFGWIGSAVGS